MLNLIEQRILDLLKYNPDSKEIYKKLGLTFSEDEIAKAFDSLIKNERIREKIKRIWSGKGFIYEGELGHWELIG